MKPIFPVIAAAVLVACSAAPDAISPTPAPDENRCFATLPVPDDPAAFGTPFETLCPDELTTTRIETLQRALQARLVYAGEITGAYDDATRNAVLEVQTPLGLPSGQLARSTAEMLGIVPVRLPGIDR